MGVVKEAIVETCDHCGARKRVADEVRGCDVCKRALPDDDVYLNYTVHQIQGMGQQIDCCSWKCVFESLKTVECDYFVSLPFLHYDDAPEGARAQDFFEAIKSLKS